jgi:hypothetical protein
MTLARSRVVLLETIVKFRGFSAALSAADVAE